MMFGLGGLGLKIAIFGIIAAIITASIGGFFLYQKSIISDLNDTITKKELVINTQKEQIAGLIIDAEKLKISNSSLESEIKRKSDETKDVFAEITRLREKDIESTNRLNSVEKILRDKHRMDVIQSIRETKKASLLLRLMDKNVKCYADNFENVEGKCILGKWVPTGERFVPKTPEVNPNE